MLSRTQELYYTLVDDTKCESEGCVREKPSDKVLEVKQTVSDSRQVIEEISSYVAKIGKIVKFGE